MSVMRAAVFDRIASGVYLEGLAVDPERDAVWYSDVLGGGVHGVRADGTPMCTFNPERMWTGGVLLNADGCVLSSGQGGVMWNCPETGKSGWLIDRIDGDPVNGINEMVPDGLGGIFFGTIDLEMVIKGAQPRSGALYHLSPAGRVTRIVDEVGFPNGMMFDPVRRRFYCNDTFRCTWAFDVGDDFSLTNRQCILERDDVDGMALDADGNLWVTGFRCGSFACLSPDGARLADFSTPVNAITQLRFGGMDMRDLYFHSVPADGGDTLKDGGALAAGNSFLFKTRSKTPGRKLQPACFKLL